MHIRLQGLYCSCKPVFCSHVTLTGYSLHSLVSPSLLLPCVTVCHHISNVVYHILPHYLAIGTIFGITLPNMKCVFLLYNFFETFLILRRIDRDIIKKKNCRSQWPRGLRRRFAAVSLLRSWVRIPPGAWIFVCCDCCVLSGRGLCDELITLPEKSYQLWCVVVCDLETSRMRGA